MFVVDCCQRFRPASKRNPGQEVRETQANSNGNVVVDCCQRFGQRNLGQSLEEPLAAGRPTVGRSCCGL